MIVYAIGIPLLMISAVIDNSVMNYIRYLNGQPSLTVMLVVSWGLLNPLRDAIPWAVIGGIFLDLLSVTPTGTTSLGFLLSLLVLASSIGQVGGRNILLPPIASSMATVIVQSVILLILVLDGWGFGLINTILTWMIPTLIFNAVGILVVFRIMGIIIEFFRPPPRLVVQ